MLKRLTQHRPRRDSNNQETQELREENRQLKRQVARLRKQIERIQDPDDSEETKSEEKEVKKPSCPHCGAQELVEFVTPSGKLVSRCRSCKK